MGRGGEGWGFPICHLKKKFMVDKDAWSSLVRAGHRCKECRS